MQARTGGAVERRRSVLKKRFLLRIQKGRLDLMPSQIAEERKNRPPAMEICKDQTLREISTAEDETESRLLAGEK